MRHRKAGKQLSRNTSHRRALLRNMVTSLFKYEQIETTDAKAKALRPVAEKLITLAKRGDLHARRQALAYIQDKAVTHRLFDVLKDRFMDRQGGYLRIVKKGNRKGDGAPISIVQLLTADERKKRRKKKVKMPKAPTARESKPPKGEVTEGKPAEEELGDTSTNEEPMEPGQKKEEPNAKERADSEKKNSE